jgi:hypothetical protein
MKEKIGLQEFIRVLNGWENSMSKESVYQDMSEPERIVSEYLRELNIWWLYEFPIFVYDEKERPRVWTPDFYLQNLRMFLEVVGSEKNYEDAKQNYQYRQKIFKKNKIDVIFVHFWKEDWRTHVVDMIRRIENVRHSQVRKMIDSFFKKL